MKGRYFRLWKLWVGWCIRRSDAIITVSEVSRKHICSLYPHVESKMHVIHNSTAISPCSLDLVKRTVSAYGLQANDYWMFVGRNMPYKHLDKAIDAFIELWKTDELSPRKFLMVVPSDNRYPVCIPHGWEPHIVHLQAVSKQDMDCLYSGTFGVVFPSEIEGFGLPTIEAMSCGKPVILADTDISREVAGEAGLYINPRSVPDIVTAMRKCLDERTYPKIAELCLDRSKRFDLKSMFSAHKCIYQLLENR